MVLPALILPLFVLLSQSTEPRADHFQQNHKRIHPRDFFVPVYEPQLVSAAAIDERRLLRPRALVIGIVREGRAQAYPVSFLGVHELVNDQIGGCPIAITW